MPFDSAPAESIERRRLRILAEFLPSVPPEKLSLRCWASCACGLAATIPEFAAGGFRLVHRTPTYGEHRDFEAVQEFFGLTWPQVQRIFYRHTYGDEEPTPADVAERIHKHLARTAVTDRAA